MDRVTQLRKFIDAQPQEPLPRYALALELKGLGDNEGAVAELQALVAQAPDYLATYLQLGMLLQVLGRTAEARDAFTRGQPEHGKRQEADRALRMPGAAS